MPSVCSYTGLQFMVGLSSTRINGFVKVDGSPAMLRNLDLLQTYPKLIIWSICYRFGRQKKRPRLKISSAAGVFHRACYRIRFSLSSGVPENDTIWTDIWTDIYL